MKIFNSKNAVLAILFASSFFFMSFEQNTTDYGSSLNSNVEITADSQGKVIVVTAVVRGAVAVSRAALNYTKTATPVIDDITNQMTWTVTVGGYSDNLQNKDAYFKKLKEKQIKNLG